MAKQATFLNETNKASKLLQGIETTDHLDNMATFLNPNVGYATGVY